MQISWQTWEPTHTLLAACSVLAPLVEGLALYAKSGGALPPILHITAGSLLAAQIALSYVTHSLTQPPTPETMAKALGTDPDTVRRAAAETRIP